MSRDRETVEVKFEEVELTNDRGHEQPGVEATCLACDHVEESYGTGDASRKRCLAMMRENCPEGQENWYVDADDAT